MDSTKNRNVVLVPSKNRPDRIKECLLALVENSSISDICICLNHDDNSLDRYLEVLDELKVTKYQIDVHLTSGNNMISSLNEVAMKLTREYDFMTFLGDDQIVSTPGWDSIMSEPLENKIGFSYPNDLHQGEALPTSVMLNSRIIRYLGFFAVPNFKHLYIDNVWLEMGKNLKNINYFENVIVEHMHYTLGKSKVDETYENNNSQESYTIGSKQFEKYMRKRFKYDMRKIRVKEFFYSLLQNKAQNKQLKK
jgi:hypothetical protein